MLKQEMPEREGIGCKVKITFEDSRGVNELVIDFELARKLSKYKLDSNSVYVYVITFLLYREKVCNCLYGSPLNKDILILDERATIRKYKFCPTCGSGYKTRKCLVGFLCNEEASEEYGFQSNLEFGIRSDNKKIICSEDQFIYPAYTYGELLRILKRENKNDLNTLVEEILMKGKS